MTYISPVKLDYYQCLCDSHFGGNLTTCWGSLCLHYGRSETFPWLFIHLSEGKEQKTLVEFSNKTTCCQQSYSFSRIFTEKFTYSIFQHLSASPQLSSFTSWKKNIQDWQEKFTKTHQQRRRYLPFSFWSFGSFNVQMETWHYPIPDILDTPKRTHLCFPFGQQGAHLHSPSHEGQLEVASVREKNHCFHVLIKKKKKKISQCLTKKSFQK